MGPSAPHELLAMQHGTGELHEELKHALSPSDCDRHGCYYQVLIVLPERRTTTALGQRCHSRVMWALCITVLCVGRWRGAMCG